LAQPLYARHPPALAATYADVENHAAAQGTALVGAPGAISVRTNASGSRFFVRQYRDFDGRKRDQYLAGKADSPESQQLAEEWRKRLDDARHILASVRLLAREGYSLLTPRHVAVIAALSNAGLFQAGAVLVGSHAFEVIANRLGIRVATYATEDVDVARPARLAIEVPKDEGFLGLIRSSGIDFVEVPPLDHRDPPTKFKERGRSRFTFDLLTPSANEEFGVTWLPELGANATAVPYLRYLLTETQTGAALSLHGVATVRVPIPERFALHKMIVARLRPGTSEKIRKDMAQAGALVAALGELHPGALDAAYGKTPVSLRRLVRESLKQMEKLLAPHPQAWEELASVALR
jgi:hypothetical protein